MMCPHTHQRMIQRSSTTALQMRRLHDACMSFDKTFKNVYHGGPLNAFISEPARWSSNTLVWTLSFKPKWVLQLPSTLTIATRRGRKVKSLVRPSSRYLFHTMMHFITIRYKITLSSKRLYVSFYTMPEPIMGLTVKSPSWVPRLVFGPLRTQTYLFKTKRCATIHPEDDQACSPVTAGAGAPEKISEFFILLSFREISSAPPYTRTLLKWRGGKNERALPTGKSERDSETNKPTKEIVSSNITRAQPDGNTCSKVGLT